MSGRGNAVVVGGLHLNGSIVTRRLQSLGYEVWSISYNSSEPGWRSRYGHKILTPDPSQDPAGWLAAMRSLADEFASPPPLLPMSDVLVVALDQLAAELEGRFLTHGFGSGLRTRLTSKRSTLELAEKHGFPRPASRFVKNREELAEFAATVDGQILVKPEFPVQWWAGDAGRVANGRKVLAGRNVDELLAAYDEIAGYTPELLAQEVIPGPDENLTYWCGFVAPEGYVAGRLVGRKERVRPPHFGSASFVRLMDRGDIESLCERFLVGLGYTGLCGIELKEDPRDGVSRLIEVNPRFGLWDYIGIPVGTDLAKEAVESLLGGAATARRPQHFDQKWVSLVRDVEAFFDYRKEGLLTVRPWLKSLLPPTQFADLPLRKDPKIAMYTLWRVAREIASQLLGPLVRYFRRDQPRMPSGRSREAASSRALR